MNSRKEAMLPAVARFVDALRGLHENEPDEAVRWRTAAERLRQLPGSYTHPTLPTNATL